MRRKIITIERKWLREINQVEMKMHAISEVDHETIKESKKNTSKQKERQTSSK